MGWLEGVWDGNSMLKFQHTYADFPAGKSPNADISAHMLERQHNEYYKLKNCLYWKAETLYFCNDPNRRGLKNFHRSHCNCVSTKKLSAEANTDVL